jgi:cytochrome P450
MDTTSNALARILHLLSTHQDVQSKLRQEIVDARSRYGNLGYDDLAALPYLDAICRETLRLSVLPFLLVLILFRQTYYAVIRPLP